MLVEKVHDGKVWIIALNRPGARNAVDAPTAELLAGAFAAFDADEHACVAVLTGTHGTFCAGADLKAVASGQNINVVQPPLPPVHGQLSQAPMGPTRMRLSKPVIAAMSGHAVAGGLELALWAGLRVAEEGTVLGVFCRRWGVPLIDGGAVRLQALLGASRAADLLLTGRPVPAAEALDMGLVHRLVPSGAALPEALALAEQLCAFPQTCMRRDLAAMKDAADCTSQAEALQKEYEHGIVSLAEARAGAAAFSAGAGRGGSFAGFGGEATTEATAAGSAAGGVADAVVFDLGGVLMSSPFPGMSRVERELQLPPEALSKLIAGGGEEGPFQRLERGELDLPGFDTAFSKAVEAHGLPGVSGVGLLAGITRDMQLRPAMLTAVLHLRQAGVATAICTNNFPDPSGETGAVLRAIAPLFDGVFESYKLGLRKPDPAMYCHVAGALGVVPARTVFLDDLGANLKAAARVGWHTIKVSPNDTTGQEAVAALGRHLHLDLVKGGGWTRPPSAGVQAALSGGHSPRPPPRLSAPAAKWAARLASSILMRARL